MKDVHTEHCCIVHGCKYSSDKCTVELAKKRQSYPCEDCLSDKAAALWYAAGRLIYLLYNLGIKSVNDETDTKLIRKMSLKAPYEYEKVYKEKQTNKIERSSI